MGSFLDKEMSPKWRVEKDCTTDKVYKMWGNLQVTTVYDNLFCDKKPTFSKFIILLAGSKRNITRKTTSHSSWFQGKLSVEYCRQVISTAVSVMYRRQLEVLQEVLCTLWLEVTP